MSQQERAKMSRMVEFVTFGKISPCIGPQAGFSFAKQDACPEFRMDTTW